MEGWAVWLGAIFFLACLPPVTQKELEMLPPSPHGKDSLEAGEKSLNWRRKQIFWTSW
ncbi:MAG: hypothetical protein V2G37_08035 [bacterium JZ-2024 1]